MADTPVPNGVQAPELVSEQQQPAAEAQDPRFEAFARKEKQLRRMQQELASERSRIEQESAKYQTDYMPKQRLMEDPIMALSELGIDTSKLSELLLNAPNTNDPTVRMFQQKIAALEKKQMDAEKRAQESVTQQYEQAKKQISTEAKMLVDSDPNYETVKSVGMADAVTELILQTFEKTGVLMDVSEAALQVENHLVEEGLKFANMGKIKSKLTPPVADNKPAAQQKPAMQTLTQSNSPKPASGRSTEKERIARAMAAFKGQLT